MAAREEADSLWARLEAQNGDREGALKWPLFSSLRKEIMVSDYATILEDPDK